jgi:hypothetical protein
MGIYSNGVIYGFSIFVDELIYKEVYDHPVDLQNIIHFKNVYNKLSQEQLEKATFSFYFEASSTYCHGEESFISPFPVSKDAIVSYLNLYTTKIDGFSC